MPAPITANTIAVTQKAQGDFQDAVTRLTTLYNSVNSTNGDLAQAMISDSSTIFRQKITQWNDDFHDIINKLNWMQEQLGNTWQQIQANEQNSQDLANGVTFVPLPL